MNPILLKLKLSKDWKGVLFKSVDSTNTKLLCDVKEGRADVGSVYVAERQTGGRGRFGRSFESPKGGIYMSFCVGDAEYELSTVTAAVAVTETLLKFGFSPRVKWVNDVLLENKKVCGILAQSVGDGKRAVIGIGINVKSDAIPKELSEIACGLDSFQKAVPQDSLIVSEILNTYKELSDTLPEGRKNIISKYKSFLTVLGEKVTVLQTGETVFAADVDDTGALMVIKENGEKTRLSSGEISIRKITTDK